MGGRQRRAEPITKEDDTLGRGEGWVVIRETLQVHLLISFGLLHWWYVHVCCCAAHAGTHAHTAYAGPAQVPSHSFVPRVGIHLSLPSTFYILHFDPLIKFISLRLLPFYLTSCKPPLLWYCMPQELYSSYT